MSHTDAQNHGETNTNFTNHTNFIIPINPKILRL